MWLGKQLQKLFKTITIMRDTGEENGQIQREPYLYRSYIFRNSVFGSLFLHRIVASDRGPEIHNHPWKLSIALILSGGYWEERMVNTLPKQDLKDTKRIPLTRMRWLQPLSFNIIRDTDFHRISLPEGKEAWTLFYHLPRRVQDWGFLYPDGTFEPVFHRSEAQEGNVVNPKDDPIED